MSIKTKSSDNINKRIELLRRQVEETLDKPELLSHSEKLQHKELLQELNVYNAELLAQTEELIQTESENEKLSNWF